ncbi:unnamed protein product [Caenorhabditis nigoni]
MVWIFLIFRRRQDDIPGVYIPVRKSHPWVTPIMIMSLLIPMMLLALATFFPGWDTNSDGLLDFRGKWALATFILMCISAAFSCVVLFYFLWLLGRIRTFQQTHEFGFLSTTCRKRAFRFLFWILLQIILICSALLTFTIGFGNMEWKPGVLGVCVYLSWAAFGSYTIAGITWFIYIWKYFHEYDKNPLTGKCQNCT